uniref:Uncharacterized protein n=1 Tax=Aegilops tauschii TaxID=37682 RepID=M8BJX2_AEGTA
MPESGRAMRRIRKELELLWTDPPAFCRPGLAPVTDLFHWEVVIDGPDGSPYAGGTFPVDVAYPKDYPFDPIKLTFRTKVYHPNIGPEGKVALDIFGSEWRPSLTISTALLSAVSVLHDPLLDRPVRRDAARLCKRERGLFEHKARDWTRSPWGHRLGAGYNLRPVDGGIFAAWKGGIFAAWKGGIFAACLKKKLVA